MLFARADEMSVYDRVAGHFATTANALILCPLRLYRKYAIELVALQPNVLVLATADEVIE